MSRDPETPVPGAGARGAGALGVLAHPGFRLLWLAEGISQLGDGLTGLALLFVIHQITGSARALAAMSILVSLPQVVLGLHAGVVADRVERRRVMIASDVLRGLAVLSLAAVTRREQLPWIYAIAIFQASVGVFFEPARAAFLPSILEKSSLLAANAVSQVSRLTAGIAGSALAGLLLALPAGPRLAFGLDALTFWISAALVAAIAGSRPAQATEAPAPDGHRAELAQGLRFLFSNRLLAGLFVTFAITMLGMGAVTVLYVPYLMDELRFSAVTLGFVRIAQTVGLVLGGTILGTFASRVEPVTLVFVGIGGVGASLVALGVVRHLGPVLAMFALMGLCSSVLQAGTSTVLMQRVPDGLRGRLEAALDTLLTVVLLGSMAGAGVMADALGTRRVLLAAGAVVVLAGIAGAVMMGRRSVEAGGTG
jgi:MFS family permease